MPRPRVTRHLVGIKPGPFAQGPRDLHAIGLEILVRQKRGVARDAIGKRRPRFDRERVDRDVIGMGRECPLERTAPASRMLPWKAAHEVARYGKPRTSRQLDCLKRHRCRMDAPDGGKLVILKALHAERDARHAGSGKAPRKLLMKRLGIRLAGELLGRAPGAHAADEPGQALSEHGRRAPADIDRAHRSERAAGTELVDATLELRKIAGGFALEGGGIESTRIEVTVCATRATKRDMQIQGLDCHHEASLESPWGRAVMAASRGITSASISSTNRQKSS